MNAHTGIPEEGVPSYQITVRSDRGEVILGAWIKTDQSLTEMQTRLAEFTAMLRNHCYQLTIDDQFIGNFKQRKHADEFCKARPGSRPVLIECFPTTPQVCLDE